MFDRFAEAARNAVTVSAAEAGRRGDRRIGTDHLLLGVLHDPTIATLLGVDLERARAASRALDQQALAAIGIDIGNVNPPVATRNSKHAPLTSGARSVLPRALTLAAAEKARRLTTKHLLLALLEREQPDPVAVLLTRLQIDRADIRAKAAHL